MNNRAAGIVIHENKVLTFWRYRNGREYYVLPGGTMEEGEKPEDTLKREMLEEMNLHVTVGPKFFEFFNTHTSPRIDNYFLITEFSGEIKLGKPELFQQTRENIFRPEWLDKEKLQLANLQPIEIKMKLLEKLQT